MIYLDNSATTKQSKNVTDAMFRCIEENFGNPSSLHRLGIKAENAIKTSRDQVADKLGVRSDEIYFTSGGTEGDNCAIIGGALSKRRQGNKIITSKIEHPAVLESFYELEKRGFETVFIDVDKNGIIDMEMLEKNIDDNTVLISVMHVNNEVGSIQPIEEIAKIKNKALFHTDAVQSFGKINVPMKGVDLLTLSGHKINGPKGIGALYIKNGAKVHPLIVGGGQERAMRAGTENVPAIVGLGVAASETKEINKVKDYLKNEINRNIDSVKINSPENGIENILNVSFYKTRAEVILHTLEQDDIYISTGSACSSNKKGRSHVLNAMGLSGKEIDGALRFSFGVDNTLEEMDIVVNKLKCAVEKFRKLGSFR